MTGDRVDATTDAAIEVIGATVGIGEVTGEATGDAGVLSATDMVLTGDITAGMRRSAARNLFPKC